MYDRAERNVCAEATGSTSPAVGPGSYQPKLPQSVGARRLRAYAPFLSMAPRRTLAIRAETLTNPGPAKYDPRLSQRNVKGGRVLSNRGKRFADRLSDAPGPGAYRLSRWGDRGAAADVGAQQEAVADAGGRLIKSHIIYDVRGQPPSVPSPGQANGYDESEFGLLQKSRADEKDTTMGPAYYNVGSDETKTTRVYKGVFFAKQTGKRMDFRGRRGPGPGDYKVTMPIGRAYDKSTPLFEAHLPRYHEIVVHVEQKKAVPGPGKYDQSGQFEQLVERGRLRTTLPHPAFGCQTQRFDPHEMSDAPAPGSYEEVRSSLHVPDGDGIAAAGVTFTRRPFNQTSLRFCPEHAIRETPGPGTYHHHGMGLQSLHHAYLTRTQGGSFGSTAVRTLPMTTRQQAAVPGPGCYEPDARPPGNRSKTSYTFASRSKRFRAAKTSANVAPPPGAYESDKAHDRTQCRQRPTRCFADHASFLSSAERFTAVPEIVRAQPDVKNPGPGAYELQLGWCGKSALMVTKTERFKHVVPDLPGPGHYTLPPRLRNTILKGTYNMTLDNPVPPCGRNSKTGIAEKAFPLTGISTLG
ncbi:PREDICTED: sperm-tail PG-rich repeat-containing protein 2-like [Priapulus caudatus]|uniref:Sperm-tail PG-rich repeat-containing protein 2-like n=1 Tax=Priapulus caudatus TaxID=37621 RepID=A0ABM1ESP0_PRICU|nr:PREDICTED: sperm-tail PG-rich repeat-containing protein 2-like [Priapulus caudatus]